jgi:hypothetical protein
MFGIDWVIWGAIFAAVAIPVGIGVPAFFYLREGRAKIKVSGQFDETGFVEVVIDKRGRGGTQIKSVELVRAGTNTKLPLISRSRTGPIEFAEGEAEVRVYFKLPTGVGKNEAIEAVLRHRRKSHRLAVTWTTSHIYPQDGTEMIDLRPPVPRAADAHTASTQGNDASADAVQSAAKNAEPPAPQPAPGGTPKKDPKA